MTLSDRRKADRSTMTRLLGDRAALAGAVVALTPEGADPYAKRCSRLYVSLRGYAATISLDGDSGQPGVFVVPWHALPGTAAKLHDMFGFAAGGSVNQYHRQKCTAVARGFDALLDQVGNALDMLAGGYAFVSEPVAA